MNLNISINKIANDVIMNCLWHLIQSSHGENGLTPFRVEFKTIDNQTHSGIIQSLVVLKMNGDTCLNLNFKSSNGNKSLSEISIAPSKKYIDLWDFENGIVEIKPESLKAFPPKSQPLINKINIKKYGSYEVKAIISTMMPILRASLCNFIASSGYKTITLKDDVRTVQSILAKEIVLDFGENASFSFYGECTQGNKNALIEFSMKSKKFEIFYDSFFPANIADENIISMSSFA